MTADSDALDGVETIEDIETVYSVTGRAGSSKVYHLTDTDACRYVRRSSTGSLREWDRETAELWNYTCCKYCQKHLTMDTDTETETDTDEFDTETEPACPDCGTPFSMDVLASAFPAKTPPTPTSDGRRRWDVLTVVDCTERDCGTAVELAVTVKMTDDPTDPRILTSTSTIDGDPDVDREDTDTTTTTNTEAVE